jgi:hypothetical protein
MVAEHHDYTIAANEIAKVMNSVLDEYKNAPDFGGWKETVHAKLLALAGEAAKRAVDAVDVARAERASLAC